MWHKDQIYHKQGNAYGGRSLKTLVGRETAIKGMNIPIHQVCAQFRSKIECAK